MFNDIIYTYTFGKQKRCLFCFCWVYSFKILNTDTYRYYIDSIIAELSRAKRRTMGKIMWLSTHPRNVVNHVTVCQSARPPVRPHHRHTNINELNQQVWRPKCNPRLFWREIGWPPASCKAETTKESIKTKTESGNCFCIRVVLSLD